MNSYQALNENSYRIGRVTVDSNLHTQSADEAFFHYFGNDVLYSIKRTIHKDDVEKFMTLTESLNETDTIKTVIKMKGCHSDYRYMLLSLTRNKILSKDDNIFIDIFIHDVLSLERLIYASEYKISDYRFMLSMVKNLAFEYNFETRRIKIYFFELFRDIIIADEELDAWEKYVKEKKYISHEYEKTLHNICSDIKNGVYRFEYELESSIFSFGSKTEFSLISGVTRYDDIESRKVMGTISIINPRSRAKEDNFAIQYNLDSLTELMNRSAVIKNAKKQLEKKPEYTINIVILNLDGFRNINNTHGHVLGDEILYETGRIIKTEIGSRGIAGRIGGDEFMMVLEGTVDEIDLRCILRAIRTKTELSFAGRNIKITCSMGIASYPKDSSEYDELFALANLGLRIAKQKGGNRYVIYDREKHGELNSSEEHSKISKASFTSQICEELFTNETPALHDILLRVNKVFELDRINIYFSNEMNCILSTEENSKNNAKYFFKDNYWENFNSDGIFAIDNINMLEGRSQSAYIYMSENNILGAIQYIIQSDENIKGIVSYELNGHFKKWSDVDISYLTIISRAVSFNILQKFFGKGDF